MQPQAVVGTSEGKRMHDAHVQKISPMSRTPSTCLSLFAFPYHSSLIIPPEPFLSSSKNMGSAIYSNPFPTYNFQVYLARYWKNVEKICQCLLDRCDGSLHACLRDCRCCAESTRHLLYFGYDFHYYLFYCVVAVVYVELYIFEFLCYHCGE